MVPPARQHGAHPPQIAKREIAAVRHASLLAIGERLVRDRADKLKVNYCPFPVEGFAVGMVWHERSHGDSGQLWIPVPIVSPINNA